MQYFPPALENLVEQFAKRVISIDEGQVISDGLDGYEA